MKNHLNSLMFLIKIHLKPLIIFIGAQLLLLIGIALLGSNKSEDYSGFFYSTWLTISVSVLVIYLGFFFNLKTRNSWITQLPVTDFVRTTLPVSILVFFGICINTLYPLKMSLPILTLGLPLTGYFIISNSKSLLSGLVKALIAAVAILVCWTFFFWSWSSTQYLYIVLLTYLFIFSGLWIAIARNRQTAFAIGLLSVCLIVNIAGYSLNKPQNFKDAVLNLNAYPTEKTIHNFKMMTQEISFWELREQYDLPTYINLRSQQFAQAYLNDEGKIKFLENINTNYEKWSKLDPNSESEKGQFFFLPITYRNYRKNIPLGNYNISKNVEEYMYANWKDTRVFSTLLPLAKNKVFIEKVLNSNWGGNIGYENSFWAYYIPNSNNELPVLVDSMVEKKLQSKDTNPIFFNRMLYNLNIFDHSNPELKKYIDERDYKKVKSFANKKQFEILRSIPTDNYEIFMSYIKNTPMSDDTFYALEFICVNIKGNCVNVFSEERLAKNDFFSVLSLNGFNINLDAVYRKWLLKELAKEENWNAIQSFLKSIPKQL